MAWFYARKCSPFRTTRGKYQFRVYDENHKFIDYDIMHSDLVAKITDSDATFYQIDGDTFVLDHNPETLGL